MLYTKAIGIRLQEILQQAKLTQTEFAEKSGISRVTINAIIKGRVNCVRIEMLIKFCRIFNINLTEFFYADVFIDDLEIKNDG